MNASIKLEVPHVKVGDYNVLLHPELGNGAFGIVYKAEHRFTGRKAAVKKIRYVNEDGSKNDELSTMAFKELKSTQCAHKGKNKNIINFFSYEIDEYAYWLFMEFCELGDLHKYIKTNQPLSEKAKFDIMHQCACAIEFLHRCDPPVIHRDIKTKNFLVTSSDGNKILVKATDFGLAKLIELDKDKMFNLQSIYMTSCGGTADYMAPEFFKDDFLKYKASVDIFSLGLVFLVVLQYGPGSPESDLNPQSVQMKKQTAKMSVGYEMQVAKDNKRPFPDIVLDEERDSPEVNGIKQLIREMVVYDPKKRLRIEYVTQRLQDIKRKTESTDDTASLSGIQVYASDVEDSDEASDSCGSDQPGYKMIHSAMENNLLNFQLLDLNDPNSSTDRPANKFKSSSSKLKRYDCVIIKKNIDEVKVLQKKHGAGGYDENMTICIGIHGIVTSAEKDCARVRFLNGESFVFNCEALEKVQRSNAGIESGDCVVVKDDKRFVVAKQNEKGSGGWNDNMAKLIGKTGIVRYVKGSAVKVDHSNSDNTYLWSASCLVLLCKGEELMQNMKK